MGHQGSLIIRNETLVSEAETVMTDKFQESARFFFCGIADLSKQETPNNISLRIRVSLSHNLKTRRHRIMKDNGLFYNFKSLPSECVAR